MGKMRMGKKKMGKIKVDKTLKTDGTISRVYRVGQESRIPLPLFTGGVSAGFPSPAEDYAERKLDLNELLISNQAATFFVRVDGDSMIGAGIRHDDILVVDRAREAKSGDIVIAVLEDELTVKRLVLKGDHGRLVAENPDYPSIEISNDNGCQIWGVVSSVVHQF